MRTDVMWQSFLIKTAVNISSGSNELVTSQFRMVVQKDGYLSAEKTSVRSRLNGYLDCSSTLVKLIVEQ